MKIKHHGLEIPIDKPFDYCELDREPYAHVLTQIIETYADGFVMAINNEWGTGKTTFVKMWQQSLINNGFNTIYFNAWENDFDNNPLVAIMSELKSLTKGDTEKEKFFKSVIEKGAVLIKNVAPALLKAVADKYIDSKVLVEAIENTAKATSEIFEEKIIEYNNKKQTIIEFREELEKFVKQADDSKPLVFIIDELDRCRPNYAVELLEQIKHLFSVKGIVFVLSIDKKHLGSSIKGFYGSESIESDEYLRRFIDFEYSIPQPSVEKFTNYLYGYYSFEEFYSFRRDKSDNASYFLKMATYLFKTNKATLRQQERIMAHTRLIMCSFKENEKAVSPLLFILVYLKVMNEDIFKSIENKGYTVQQLSDAFTNFVKNEKQEINGINLLYAEAMLLWFYNNSLDYHKKEKLFEKDSNSDSDSVYISPINSKLDMKEGKAELTRYFGEISHNFDFDDFSLSDLLVKINLTKSIKV